MCGIAGFTGGCDREILERFQKALHHRGPDERGIWCDRNVGLSSNRLAIIDLQNGRQPIFNEDQSCAIVFNGEIYNYKELRKGLESTHQFRTRSDTEVILHLYEDKGTRVSEYLRGDFAFCIWDSRNGSCFLSRDHLGVKPLFYAVTDKGNLVFSSELGALLEHPDLSPSLDLQSLQDYLTLLYVPAPRSIVRDVKKLGAGESLVWRDGSVRVWKYWDIPDVIESSCSSVELRERVHEKLRLAVRRRLIADVPVGAFLSGGLDSSLLVALASEESSGLMTFSVGYGERDFNELPFARIVSRRFQTTHHEVIVSPQAEDLVEDVIAAMDEPIADSSAIPTFLIARETRRYLKVVMSGVGGDELFFGYPRYLGAKISEQIPEVARPLVALFCRLFTSAPSGRDLGGWARRFGAGLSMTPLKRYSHWTSFLQEDQASQLLVNARRTGGEDEYADLKALAGASGSYLDKIFRLDLRRYLASDLLKFGDGMTMANSLELRVPFCDVDLVTEIASIPAGSRLPGYSLKPILRDIARDYLPREILNRKKQGFMIPIGRWFRTDLKQYLMSNLTQKSLPRCLRPEGVERLLSEHLASLENHTHLIWGILVLTRWLAQHPQIQIEL